MTLSEAKREDPVIVEALKYVQNGQKVENKPTTMKTAYLVRESQKMQIDDDGVLCRKTASQSQLLWVIRE